MIRMKVIKSSKPSRNGLEYTFDDVYAPGIGGKLIGFNRNGEGKTFLTSRVATILKMQDGGTEYHTENGSVYQVYYD